LQLPNSRPWISHAVIVSSFDATTQRFLSSQSYSAIPEMRRQVLSQETPGA